MFRLIGKDIGELQIIGVVTALAVGILFGLVHNINDKVKRQKEFSEIIQVTNEDLRKELLKNWNERA